MTKRCAFLSAVIAALDLPATVHRARAESLSLKVDIVTARACAPLRRLLDFAWPYMSKGATGLFLKGRDIEAELADAARDWNVKAAILPSRSDASGRILKIEELARAQR